MADEQDTYAQQRERKRLEREGEGVPDGAGWKHRTGPGGEVEWCPAGESFAPPGWEWAMDDEGGYPHFGADGRKIPPRRVPKLREIALASVRPSRRPAIHFDSALGVPYR